MLRPSVKTPQPSNLSMIKPMNVRVRPTEDRFWRRPVFAGTILGIVSAVGYTAATIFLRSVVHCDPAWVSCIKATTTAVLLTPWLLCGPISRFPSGTGLATLIAAGLFGQLGGNVLFQWSLGILGMSLTVPLCLGSIILCSVLLGRSILSESVNVRTVLSMAMLVAAIWSLSWGVGSPTPTPERGASQLVSPRLAEELANSQTEAGRQQNQSAFVLTAAVLSACIAGLAYAVLGVAIRRCVIADATVVGTTWTIATVGVVSLLALSQRRLGWAGMLATSAADLQIMLLAGVCNLVAFVSLARALQLTTLVYVNGLNASQVVMAAIAGLYLFGEPASAALFVGVALTVGGLLIMPRPGSSGSR